MISSLRHYYALSQTQIRLEAVLVWAIEIKRGAVPTISKGFHIASEDIGVTRKFVVYGGRDEFSLGSVTRAVSIEWMMEEVKKL